MTLDLSLGNRVPSYKGNLKTLEVALLETSAHVQPRGRPADNSLVNRTVSSYVTPPRMARKSIPNAWHFLYR
jgi:hypothetical protein